MESTMQIIANDQVSFVESFCLAWRVNIVRHAPNLTISHPLKVKSAKDMSVKPLLGLSLHTTR